MSKSLSGRILAAMRQNLLPGLILWCIGLALVCSYYFWTETRPAFEKVIQWKVQYGYVYSALSTAFFGGVIPYFYLRWSEVERIGLHWGHGVLFIAYWALRGLDVDAFYRLQDWLFGSDNHWQTIAKLCYKVESMNYFVNLVIQDPPSSNSGRPWYHSSCPL